MFTREDPTMKNNETVVCDNLLNFFILNTLFHRKENSTAG